MVQRLDKWLVYARFVRHRSNAAALIDAGHVRVNRVRVLKHSHAVKASDVLTIGLAGQVRVVRVVGEADRRGSAIAAGQLFIEIETGSPDSSPPEKAGASPNALC